VLVSSSRSFRFSSHTSYSNDAVVPKQARALTMARQPRALQLQLKQVHGVLQQWVAPPPRPRPRERRSLGSPALSSLWIPRKGAPLTALADTLAVSLWLRPSLHASLTRTHVRSILLSQNSHHIVNATTRRPCTGLRNTHHSQLCNVDSDRPSLTVVLCSL
jgi:hypothetical protein